jgi:hypothetical protein
MPPTDSSNAREPTGHVTEPSFAIRAARLASVLSLAARIYLPYKAIQLWSRLISDQRKEQRYRRQDLRAARIAKLGSVTCPVGSRAFDESVGGISGGEKRV